MVANIVSLDERRAYLLDVSLFIFDILSIEQIIRNASRGNAIFEVPSALVTMIRSSISGSNLLQDLIYGYLVGLRNNGTFSRSANEQFRRLGGTTDQDLRNLSVTAYERILGFYSRFIDGGRRSQNDTFYPIGRYEPILTDQSGEDLDRLQQAYHAELGIQAHPLYDLYFLQIHHALSVGVAASPPLPRVFVFLSRQASDAISRWIGETDSRALNLNTRERYRRSLAWFINEHIVDQFLDVAIDIGIAFMILGVPGINILAGASAANLIRKLVIDTVVRSPYFIKETDVPALLGVVVVLMIACAFVSAILPRTRQFINILSHQSLSPAPTSQLPIEFNPPQFTVTPTVQTLDSFATEIPLPTLGSIIIPNVTSTVVPALFTSDANYCIYVIQPGDAMQTVASRFQITENDLRSSDILVGKGAFMVHQQIRVNSPCCTVVNGQGFSHTVRRGETLYRIARSNSVAVERLATINNLYNPRYIQVGQMLCIPYP